MKGKLNGQNPHFPVRLPTIPAMLDFISNTTTKRRLAIVTLAVSVIAHGTVILIVLLLTAETRVEFEGELLALIGCSIILEFAGCFVPGVGAFRAIHVARFLTLLSVFHLLEGNFPTILATLSIPFLIETVMYDNGKVAYPANIAFVCTAVLFIIRRFKGDGSAALVSDIVSYIIVTTAIGGIVSLLVYYREQLVEKSAQIENLRATVLNLSDANKAFQRYAGNVESESAERERNRITRELHDLVGYALTNVIVMMNAGRILLKENSAELDVILEKVGNQTEQALNETRQTLHLLRSVRSYEPRGIKAISQLIQSFQGATGIKINLHVGNIPWSLGQRLDSALFRFIQEGLTNAFHHGKADRIQVQLWRTEREIRVSVRDNGRGVESDGTVIEGIGLAGMRERIAAFGGTVSTRNVVDGFELRAVIPYRMGEMAHENQSADR